MFNKFWHWYEKNYKLNVGLAAGLFVLQLIHLYWLSAHVVSHRLLGRGYFELEGIWEILILIVDYTEIPAIITTSFVYIHALRRFPEVEPRVDWQPAGEQRPKIKDWLYLLFINSQWLHIFWITDEFVIEQFARMGERATLLPVWLAWSAIAIDYLELPVIYDTIRKFFRILKK